MQLSDYFKIFTSEKESTFFISFFINQKFLKLYF